MTKDYVCRCNIGDPRCQYVADRGYTCLRTRAEHGEESHPFAPAQTDENVVSEVQS